ncbi:MAG: succinate dehydrogenase, hydrophobic membrane anchor protein [Hyphomicrobium sp.]
MSLRTPLKNARQLGSAKEGADHFWKQRVTGVANFILVFFLIWVLGSLAGAPYATVVKTLARPEISLPLLFLIFSGTFHMRLGMQTIIEDYVHQDGMKILLLILNTFFSLLICGASALAILKLFLGA